MKKLFTLVFTMLLGASLAFAQAAGSGSTGQTDNTATTTKTKKHHKGHHHKKKKADGDAAGSANPK